MTIMNITRKLDGETVLRELGERLARRRLDLQLTQAMAAEQAGVSKRTLERMEAGATVQLSSFIRILRALDLMDGLERLIPQAGPRPLDLLKLRGRERKRASPRGKSSDRAEESEWHWGEDS